MQMPESRNNKSSDGTTSCREVATRSCMVRYTYRLFWTYYYKSEINKRSRGKCFGVIFSCLATRAVHSDTTSDFSTNEFLLVFRRVVTIRGFTAVIYADNGTQLRAVAKEMRDELETDPCFRGGRRYNMEISTSGCTMDVLS